MNDEVAVQRTNPFGAVARQTATANTDQQRAIAEVQAAMIVARAHPRDPIAAMDRILNACSRPTLAEAAIYEYARGGSPITGPSIRLAECIAVAWGNLQFGIRELEQRNNESTVQAYAWDVESNTRSEVTFQVPHERHTKRGVTQLEDPRDVYELVANQGARRLRARILAVVPSDVVDAAVRQCEVTMQTTADTSAPAMAKMVGVFAQFGVTQPMIEKRIQRRLDAITAAQVVALKKVYASLRDGMSAPADWFEFEPEAAPAAGLQAVRAATKEKRAAKAAKEKGGGAADAPAPPPDAPVDPGTGEVGGSEAKPIVATAAVMSRLQTAIFKSGDREIAGLAIDEARSCTSPEQYESLLALWKRTWEPEERGSDTGAP